jgi:hypothetical protein
MTLNPDKRSAWLVNGNIHRKTIQIISFHQLHAATPLAATPPSSHICFNVEDCFASLPVSYMDNAMFVLENVKIQYWFFSG